MNLLRYKQVPLLLIAGTLAIGTVLGAVLHRNVLPLIARPAQGVTVPSNERYVHRASIFREFPATGDVVMAGDSITEMGDWTSIFPNVRILNRGIGWDNTAGLLARIDTINNTEAKTVFLMIGTNDVEFTDDVDDVFSRYEMILASMRPGATVYVQSTILKGKERTRQNAEIMRLNEKLQALCESGACQYIDLNKRLAPEGYLPKRYSLDGVHLDGPAYRIWADEIRPLMPS